MTNRQSNVNRHLVYVNCIGQLFDGTKPALPLKAFRGNRNFPLS